MGTMRLWVNQNILRGLLRLKNVPYLQAICVILLAPNGETEIWSLVGRAIEDEHISTDLVPSLPRVKSNYQKQWNISL